MKLLINQKQKRFCYEYIKDFDATKAAIRAGYSPKNANSFGSLVLKKHYVAEFLEQLLNEKSESLQEAVDKLISEFIIIAFSTTDGKVIKTANKLKALEMLGKYFGLFRENKIGPSEEPVVHVFFEDKTRESEK